MLLKQMGVSRKVKKADRATGKSMQEGQLTNDEAIHLPKINTESETDFVKDFLIRNNKPYIQPK